MDDVDPETWERDLRENRAEKDRFLAEHPQSPIPPAERDDFDGLEYYPPEPDYRVRATVERHETPEPLELETTDGPPVRYLRPYTLSFEVDGRQCSLCAYRQETDDDGGLFVPFRDATSGAETYDLGRYMDLRPERTPGDGEAVPLDFNLAYAPFCAFSDAFACPLPPAENHLDVAIRAGERV